MEKANRLECRACGACCIAISISPAFPALPEGKKAGERCVHLTEKNLCNLFESPDRPRVCGSFPAMLDICGRDFTEAMELINQMEKETEGA